MTNRSKFRISMAAGSLLVAVLAALCGQTDAFWAFIVISHIYMPKE